MSLLRLQLLFIGFTIWFYSIPHVFRGVAAGEELMPKTVDDPTALRRLLDESGVSVQVTEHIISQGYTTIALLGYAVPKADALEDFVKFLTPSSAGSEFQPFSPQVACLRRAVKKCFDATQNDPGIDSPSRAHGGESGAVASCQAPKTWGQPPSLETRLKNWGQPPRLEDRVKAGSKGDGEQNVQSVCKTIATSDVAEILRGLCFWQSLATSMSLDELTQKITTADWYSLMLSKLAEGVTFLTGCPNSGKSSLATNIVRCLGLSELELPRGTFGYCTDSFYDGNDFQWDRMKQSVDSKFRDEEFKTGALIIEGHRALQRRSCLPRLQSCRGGAPRPNQSESTSYTYQRRCLEK